MGAGDRIKSWLRRDESAGASASADLPAFPVPAPHQQSDAAPDAPPGEPAGATEPTEPQRTSGESAEENLSEALPLALDQELLGPCRDCDGYWTRLKVRGQKPLTCPACKQAA